MSMKDERASSCVLSSSLMRSGDSRYMVRRTSALYPVLVPRHVLVVPGTGSLGITIYNSNTTTTVMKYV